MTTTEPTTEPRQGMNPQDLADLAFWHLLLTDEKDEARANVVELCQRLREQFRDIYGEDLVALGGLAELLDDASRELAAAVDAWPWYGFETDERYATERRARCGELAHDLGHAWLARRAGDAA